MALHTRKDYFGADTRVKTEEIFRTSRLLSTSTGVHVQPNKAIVARTRSPTRRASTRRRAQGKLTYEIMKARGHRAAVQQASSSAAFPGRHALAARLKTTSPSLRGSDRLAFKTFTSPTGNEGGLNDGTQSAASPSRR